MEYRLLKTIESSQLTLLPKETLPRLTSYPANNCVNPGLGQIARLYSFYVPLYSNHSLHSISKKEPNVEPVDEQEGAGNIDMDITKPDLETEQKPKENNVDEFDLNPIEFNEKKRKLLGAAVHESFIHPKLIKTNKISFSKQNVTNEKQVDVRKTSVNEKNPVKHKFQFE